MANEKKKMELATDPRRVLEIEQRLSGLLTNDNDQWGEGAAAMLNLVAFAHAKAGVPIELGVQYLRNAFVNAQKSAEQERVIENAIMGADVAQPQP